MTDVAEPLRVYLTGGVRVERGDSLIRQRDFSFPHAVLLLAYFVCERGRPVPGGELAGLLWPEGAPADGESVVRATTQKLRRALAHQWVGFNLQVSGRDLYELEAPNDTWVDIEAAAGAIHDAEGELRAGRPAGAFGPSAVAHHIARRPFLVGETGPWVDAQRARLRTILVRALECRGEVFLWNRETLLAVEAAKEAILLEPLRETAHQLLIRAHASLGNAADANRAYQQCREILSARLSIEPSSQTTRVYQNAVGDRCSATQPIDNLPTVPPQTSDPGADVREKLQRLLGDAYRLDEELPGGGMSRVFLAEERALNRQVVIKVLPPDKAETFAADRFAREVRLAARLQQANIVPLLTAAVVGDTAYYTMPFVAGRSLRHVLSRESALPISSVTSLLRDVGRALAFAHMHGVVHRDIKPENILLSGATAVVTDFGIAKALEAATATAAEASPLVTKLGMRVGTPRYMAPEQIAGDPTVDHRADIYSYGIVGYELLAGRPPFTQEDAQATLAAHLSVQPRNVRELRADAPPALSDLLMRCIDKDRRSRPQTMEEVLAVLEEAGRPT